MYNTDFKIRQAKEEDLAILLEFEQGIVAAERPMNPVLKEGIIHYYDLKEKILSPDAEIVVAEVDNQVVGSGFAEIKKAEEYEALEYYAYLYFMYVRPAFRGQGINQAIIDTLKDWAASRNIFELRLQVYNENTAAIKAYEKAGFKGSLLEMRLGTT